MVDQQPMPLTRDDVEAAVDALRRRHRAAPADGVGGEGRWPAAPRARARGRGGRARAAPRARRPLRRSRSSSRGRTRRPPCWSSAGAARTCARSPPISVSRSVAARISRRCAAWRSARSRSPRRIRSTTSPRDPDAAVLSLATAMRDLERVDVDDEQARAVRHGMAFPVRRARGARRRPVRARGAGRRAWSRSTNGAAPRANLRS